MLSLLFILAVYVLPVILVFALDHRAVHVEIESSWRHVFTTELTSWDRHYRETKVGLLVSCALMPLLNIVVALILAVKLVKHKELYTQGRKFKAEVEGEKIDSRLDELVQARQKFNERRIKELERKAYS